MLVPINEQTWSLISNNVLSITHSGSDVVTQLDSGRLRLLEKNLESSLTSCCQRDGWNRVEDSGKWNAQLLGLTATWCEVPHPCPNCLFFISSRWNREGVVKSTDMLALGGPPCKNSSFCAAVDTYSCRFLSSQDTLADEFRNYTGFPNCYYGTKQALLRTSSWPHQCPVRHRGREEKRKKKHWRPVLHPSGALGQVGKMEYMQRNHSRTIIKVYVHRCKIIHTKISYKMMGSIKW